MPKFVNRAFMTTATTGTGTLTLGAAKEGYQTFADAGVLDGDTVSYAINDGVNWEIGTGVYTATGTTLSRTVSESSNADAAINLSGSAEVFVTVGAGDFATAAQGTTADNALPKAGGAMSGRLDLTKGAREAASAMPANSIDMANGGLQTRTLTTNTTFTENLSDGDSILLRLGGGDVYTVTWPTMTWVGGTAPTLTANDVLVIWQEGTTVYGSYLGSVV